MIGVDVEGQDGMRQLLEPYEPSHVHPAVAAPRREGAHRDGVAREREVPTDVLVPHVERGDRRGRAGDPEAPLEPRLAPRPRDADAGREHPLHLTDERGHRLEQGEIHAVGFGPHR